MGDQFHYLITVDYAPQFEFVLDNLNKENVNMDPFSVIDVVKTVTPLGNNGNRLVRPDITMASFSYAQTDARIPQISLYYFRRDQHAGGPEQAAAESLTVLGPTIISQHHASSHACRHLATSVTVTGWERSRWVVPAITLHYAGDLAGLAGVGEVFLLSRSERSCKRPDPRVSMKAVRASLVQQGACGRFPIAKQRWSFLTGLIRT